MTLNWGHIILRIYGPIPRKFTENTVPVTGIVVLIRHAELSQAEKISTKGWELKHMCAITV